MYTFSHHFQQNRQIIIGFFVEINKYKANIYADFTILSFPVPTSTSPHSNRHFRTIPRSHQPSQNRTIPRPALSHLDPLSKGELLLLSFAQPTIEGLPHRTLSSPQPFQKDNNPSPHVCPFIQYVNHSPVCSPAHSSAFGTASPQDRCKAPK